MRLQLTDRLPLRFQLKRHFHHLEITQKQDCHLLNTQLQSYQEQYDLDCSYQKKHERLYQN